MRLRENSLRKTFRLYWRVMLYLFYR